MTEINLKENYVCINILTSSHDRNLIFELLNSNIVKGGLVFQNNNTNGELYIPKSGLEKAVAFTQSRRKRSEISKIIDSLDNANQFISGENLETQFIDAEISAYEKSKEIPRLYSAVEFVKGLECNGRKIPEEKINRFIEHLKDYGINPDKSEDKLVYNEDQTMRIALIIDNNLQPLQYRNVKFIENKQGGLVPMLYGRELLSRISKKCSFKD